MNFKEYFIKEQTVVMEPPPHTISVIANHEIGLWMRVDQMIHDKDKKSPLEGTTTFHAIIPFICIKPYEGYELKNYYQNIRFTIINGVLLPDLIDYLEPKAYALTHPYISTPEGNKYQEDIDPKLMKKLNALGWLNSKKKTPKLIEQFLNKFREYTEPDLTVLKI